MPMKSVKSILRPLKRKLIPPKKQTGNGPEPVKKPENAPEWENLTDDEFSLLAARCVEDGTIDDLVSDMILSRGSMNKEYLKRFSIIRNKIRRKFKDQQLIETRRKLFNAHSLVDFTYEQMQDVFHLRFPVFQASSYTVNLIRRRRMRQIGQVPERWLTHSKEAADCFIKKLDVCYPKTTYHVKFKDIQPATDIVIKPCIGRGARGAYLVTDFDNIMSLTNRIRLHSWQEMEENVGRELKSGVIGKDDFIVQQLIYDDPKAKTPARDLKFYSFYGEVGLVLEASRYPVKEYWWWSADGKPVETGKYEKPKGEGHGVTQEQIEIAKYISLQIPAPFMRIDFLRGHDEQIYLAEFCTSPGRFEQFNKETDRHLGDLYLKAEMRLLEDVLNGKRFDHIAAFNEEWERRVRRNRK
jgi:hypothetical protein